MIPRLVRKRRLFGGRFGFGGDGFFGRIVLVFVGDAEAWVHSIDDYLEVIGTLLDVEEEFRGFVVAVFGVDDSKG